MTWRAADADDIILADPEHLVPETLTSPALLAEPLAARRQADILVRGASITRTRIGRFASIAQRARSAAGRFVAMTWTDVMPKATAFAAYRRSTFSAPARRASSSALPEDVFGVFMGEAVAPAEAHFVPQGLLLAPKGSWTQSNGMR